MRNSKAAEILFGEARASIDNIVAMLDEYNYIADALTEMGYAEPERDEFLGSEPWPVPALQLSSGTMDYSDSSFLDRIREAGPIAKPEGGLISARKFSRAAERNRLGKESGWRCLYCGVQGDDDKGPDGRRWHVDHAFPVIRGGDDQADNLVLACATCNLEKRAMSAAEYFNFRSTFNGKLP